MTQYYVATTGNDSNPGTSGSPWATFSKAASVAVAGDTVNFADGNYPVGAGTTQTANGTAGSHIVFQSTNQFGAKFTAGGVLINTTGTFQCPVQIQGNYVDFKNFELNGGTDNWSIGIYATGSHDTIFGCKVHDLTVTGRGGNGGEGIEADDFALFTDNKCIVDSCIIYNIGTSPDNNTHGVYIAQLNMTVQNCLIWNCAAWGITSYHSASAGWIINNTIFNNHAGGIGLAFDSAAAYHGQTTSSNWV